MNWTFRIAWLNLVLAVGLLAGCGGDNAPMHMTDRSNGGAAVTVQPGDLANTRVEGTFAVSTENLRNDLYYLASDQLEGRGIDSPGINLAADFIANRFKSLGLKPLPGLSGYFQPFDMTTSDGVARETTLALDDGGDFKLKEQFTAASFSAEKPFAGAVVFAGYSVSSKERKYDDFEGIDARGKVVLAMRFEPHDPKTGKSRWGGSDYSPAAHLETKAKAAAEHGAIALVLVNPPDFHDHGDDPLLTFSRQTTTTAAIPVLQVKRTVANEILKKAGGPELRELQKQIDEAVKPASRDLKGAKLSGKVAIQRKKRAIKNVVAMIPGSGPTAGEYVIIGAHYDHLGWGGPASLMNMPLLQRQPGVTEPENNGPKDPARTQPSTQPSSKDSPSTKPVNPHQNPHASPHGPTTTASTLPTTRAIHHGADDNGSGTAAILELARLMSQGPPPARTLVFIAFTAEESGLIGSGHFARNPPIDLKKVAAMLNLDMVGRVRKNLIYVGGSGTAAPFDAILKKADQASPLEFKNFGKGGLGPSDHMSFALKKVPVLFFFTGTHEDYHRPTDTADKINYDGMAQTVKVSAGIIKELERMPMSKYDDSADRHSMMTVRLEGETGARRAALGIIPEYGAEEDGKGVHIGGTSAGTAAEKAGLKAGDVVLQLGDKATGTLMELSAAIASFKPGDKVKLTYRRGETTTTVEVTLGSR